MVHLVQLVQAPNFTRVHVLIIRNLKIDLKTTFPTKNNSLKVLNPTPPCLLFASMPETFTRRQLLERAVEASIPENTVNGWLKRLTKRGVLTNVDGKGTYHKGVISA